jgi:HYR domain
MRRWTTLAAAALALGALAAPTTASAAEQTTTVRMVSGDVDPETGLQATTVSLGSRGSGRAAAVLTPPPLAGWNTLPGTRWMGDSWLLDDRQDIATYFRRTFTVPATATSIELDLCALSDGAVNVLLNGSPVLGSPHPVDSPANWTTPTCNRDGRFTPRFVHGVNVLDFQVLNGTGPMGLDYDATLTYRTRVNEAPSLQLPADMTLNATSPSGIRVSWTVGATDDSGRTPDVTCDRESGENFPIGGTAVYCTATDAEGLSTTGFFRIQVLGAADQLAALRRAVTGVGPGRSLADKVAETQAALAARDSGTACRLLTDLGSQLRAQSGKRVPAATAATLRADAARIASVLGCNGEPIPQE